MAFPKSFTATKKPRISLDALQEEIRKVARIIFDERTRKGLNGDDLSDWLRAEKEVKAQYGL